MSLQPLSRAIRGLTRIQKQKLGNIPRIATQKPVEAIAAQPSEATETKPAPSQ